MKQIGLRHEAAKIGGIGSCGRELCCSTWMTAFPSSLDEKQLDINSFQLTLRKYQVSVGRLKCCLNFLS